MGPRARARGNKELTEEAEDDARLQWGHERALVEIHQIRFLRAVDCPASMGPRARARGNLTRKGVCALSLTKLQWGHERALVEMPVCAVSWAPRRCFNGATSARSWKWLNVIAHVAQPLRFNGATSARSWKSDDVAPAPQAHASFNGAT